MTNREFFQVRRQAERDVFLRVIRAMPAGRLDYKPHERSPSAADLLATLVSEHGICGDEQPIGEFLWFILFDAIHHRGQLSTYIRPMGGQVPAIYGPSGDSRR